MSPRSAKRGAAFEYLTIKAVENNLNGELTNDTEIWCDKNKSKFESLHAKEKDEMEKASKEIVVFLKEYINWVEDDLYIEKISSRGSSTDVTDVRLFNNNNSTGLSLKSNHKAAKHPRVSPNIDIIGEWTGFSVDKIYMKKINNIFANLTKYTKNNNISKFNQIENIFTFLYKPICEAVANSLNRIFTSENGIEAMQNFIKYMVGSKDFYKINADFKNSELIIESYNLRGNLNIGEQLQLPTKCFKVSAEKSSRGNWNRVELSFNNGWKINMRLHNAESKIKKSLKFDTRIVEVPQDIWKKRRSF